MYDILKNEKHQTKQRYKKRKKYYGRRNVFRFKVKDKEKEVYNLGFQHIFGYQ